MNKLSTILSQCYRKTSWGLVEDPIAQDILKSPYFNQLESSLEELNLPTLKPLGFGTFHLVLSADDNVIRIGLGTLQEYPNIEEVLQPLAHKQIGTLKYEIMPKADIENVTDQHLKTILEALEKKGYYWGDAGLDNIGLINGQPIIIDSDGIKKIQSKNTINTLKIK